jgi:multiple sugar transport system permease protein
MSTGSSLQQALLQANIWQMMGQDVTSNPLFVSMILNTAGILVMLPVLIMYFFLQKLFVEGIEKSGIVG